MEVGIILWLAASIVALSVGSFINVVVYRLPLRLLTSCADITLICPRSHCPCCKTPLRWRDNLPLIGWLLLHGKCYHCQKAISLRYPVVEAFTLFVSLLLVWLLPFTHELLAALLLCWMLTALTLIDIEHQLLPDALTLPLLWSGLLLHLFHLLPGNLAEAVAGAAIGYGTLWLLAIIYRSWRGTEGLGMGDAKLLAALGAWLGWQDLPMLLLIAASGGLCWALLLKLAFRQDRHHYIAFGPWLAIAGVLLYLKSLLHLNPLG